MFFIERNDVHGEGFALNTQLTMAHRPSVIATSRSQYQFSRAADIVTPLLDESEDIKGEAEFNPPPNGSFTKHMETMKKF